MSRKGGELAATSCAGWYVVLVAATAAPLDVHLESRVRRQELGDDAALPLNQSGSPVITAAERRRRRAAEEVRAAARAEARQKAVDEAKAKAARDMDLLRQERKAAQLKARKVAKKERKRRVKDQAASTGAMSSDGASVKSRGSPTRRMKVRCACFAVCAVAVPYWELPRVLYTIHREDAAAGFLAKALATHCHRCTSLLLQLPWRPRQLPKASVRLAWKVTATPIWTNRLQSRLTWHGSKMHDYGMRRRTRTAKQEY